MTRQEPRRGLVLGAGGALGAAWMIGALKVLEEQGGYDARGCEVVVGTSAGSVIAAMLGCGMSVTQLADRLDVRGEPQVEGTGPVNPFDVHAALAAIPRPVLLPGNLRLAARTFRRPHKHTLMTLAAGLAPRGRGTLVPLAGLIADVQADRGWPDAPTTYVVAMDYDTGRRVVFGRTGAPAVDLPAAVIASCSAPGFFPPTTIGARRYVDGGAVSVTNADVLLGCGLDEVLVLAPMASFVDERRLSPAAAAERRIRAPFSRRLMNEVRRVEAAGTPVHVLAPTGADLHVMGINMMNPGRRREVLHSAIESTRAQLGSSGPSISGYGRAG